MRIAAIVCAALLVSSCDVGKGTGIGGSVLAPTPAVTAIIAPQLLTTVPIFTAGCPFVPAFSTNFSLIVSGSAGDLFVRSVTVRLNDGSGLSGSTLTFPQAEIDRRFGSAVVVDGREFDFHPQFGCGVIQPRGLSAEIIVANLAGTTRTLTAQASFR
jgi:hypothetical protein